MVDVVEIDVFNIYQVMMFGMCCVVEGVVYVVQFVCIDGNVVFKGLFCLVQVLVGGDVLDCVIMVVLILVKVSCDCYMLVLYEQYFEYGFDQYKGYGILVYLVVLCMYGFCLQY